MKALRLFWFAALVAFLALPRIFAADKAYSEGTVWDVTFVRTKYGHGDEYLGSLQRAYKTMMDAAIKEGYVVSYKILSSEPSSRSDWDLMLMVEYKNMAALDGISDKMEAIQEKIAGGRSGMDKMRDQRAEIREILGTKLCRELILK